MFQYQNPVIAFLVKIANMLIASFCWLLGCIPIVTLLPACAALHTTVDRAVFTGRPVVRTFWEAYRSAMKPGISLSIGCQVLGALLYLGIHTGLQIWSTGIFGACYMALGVLLGALFVVTVICLPPVLSRFEGGAVTILRLAVYFSGRKLLRTALFAVLLALMFLAVDFFPLLLLVLPAVYADLFRGPIGRDMTRYIRENGLEEAAEPQPPQPEQEESALGALEWDRVLSGKAEEEAHGQH